MQMGCHVQTFVSLSEYTYEHFCKRMEMDQSGFPAQVEGYFFFFFLYSWCKVKSWTKICTVIPNFFFFGMETKFFKRRLALRQAGGGRVAVLRWWVDYGIMHTSMLYSQTSCGQQAQRGHSSPQCISMLCLYRTGIAHPPPSHRLSLMTVLSNYLDN